MTATATVSRLGAGRTVRDLGLASPGVWDRLADAAPDATFFHTRAWADSLTQTFPFLHNATRAFELDDGAVAVLPLIERRWLRGVFVTCQSMAPGVYGGPIAERPLRQDEVEAIIRGVLGPRVARLRVNGSPYASWQAPSRYTTLSDFTQAIDLTQGADAVLAASSEAHRRNLRKARASGLQVFEASSDADYAAYYAAYEDSIRRWGDQAMTAYPLELLLNIRDRCGDAVRLWLVSKDDKVIGGVLNLYHNRRVVYWHGASLESHFEFRPANFVQSVAIRDACDRGFEWYDLNPSGGLEGVVRFKQSLGARRLDYEDVAIYGNPAFAAAARLPALLRSRMGHRGF